MSVCYVFQDEYPWDVRVEKIVVSLASHGIPTYVIARNRRGESRHERLQADITVHRLPAIGHPLLLRDLLNFPAFFSPVWLSQIRSVVRRTGAKLLIVRDLPLAPAALVVGRGAGIPVVLDMAENYPAMLEDTQRYRGRGLFDLVLRNPDAWRLIERFILPSWDAILVVSEHSADRLVALGAPREKIWVVGNTPRVDIAALADGWRQDGTFRLTYVGGMEESRGLDVAVRAMVDVVKQIPEAQFIIVGRGTAEAGLKSLARDLHLADHIVFTGWVSPKQIPSIIGMADVCIVPHYVTEHTTTTIPNKIFDYMLQGKPVIVTDALAIRTIVESTGCGLIYHDTDPAALAAAVIALRADATRRQMGAAGRQAVLSRYNWTCDEKILLDVMRHFRIVE